MVIRNNRNKQIHISILKRVWRIAHAADRIAPHGPPAAVPAAISEAAFPPSTLAFTVAAAALAVASAPFTAVCFVASWPACFAAFAICPAACP